MSICILSNLVFCNSARCIDALSAQVLKYSSTQPNSSPSSCVSKEYTVWQANSCGGGLSNVSPSQIHVTSHAHLLVRYHHHVLSLARSSGHLWEVPCAQEAVPSPAAGPALPWSGTAFIIGYASSRIHYKPPPHRWTSNEVSGKDTRDPRPSLSAETTTTTMTGAKS